MQFTPKSEKQLKEEMLIPKGDYPFTVDDAEETTSKEKGNPMFAVKLKVELPDGKTRIVRDWLMVGTASMEYKLRHFCAATGLLDKWNAGKIEASDMYRAQGIVSIIQKDDGGDFGLQNKVKDYVVPEDGAEGADLATNTAKVTRTQPASTIGTPVGAGQEWGGKGPMSADDIPF